MTTPALLTLTDVQTRVMNMLRIPVTNTTEATKIAALVNEVYRDLYVKADWWFLRKLGIINTQAPYSTGTVTLTSGQTAGTFGTAPGASLGSFAGAKIIVTGDTTDPQAAYRISAHTAAAAAFTLDAAFTGTTTTTGTFNVYFDEYSVNTDLGKLLRVQRWGVFAPCEIIEPQDMSLLKGVRGSQTGAPQAVCIDGFATTGDPTTARRLVVFPYPDNTYRMELTYKQQLNTELSGTTQPFLPDEYRQALVYGSLSRGFPVFLGDVDRGKFYLELFNDVLNLMVAAHREYNDDRAQIAPRDTDRGTQRSRRRGHASLGALFDVWPMQP